MPRKPPLISYPRFEAFQGLITLRMVEGTKSPGHAIKTHLGSALKERSFGGPNKVQLVRWQLFFKYIKDNFYDKLDPRLVDVEQTNQDGAINKTINTYWTSPKNTTQFHTAFILYYWLHETPENEIIALNVDRDVIGNFFEQVYKTRYPQKNQDMIDLFKREKAASIQDKPNSSVRNTDANQVTLPGDVPRTVSAIDLPLPNVFYRRKSEIQSYHSEFLRDYEPHVIEEEFEEEFIKSKGGYWILEAGPGKGKSTILASLARKKIKSANCISYVFRQEFDNSDRNNVPVFHEFLIHSLIDVYRIELPKFDRSKEFSSQLAEILLIVSGRSLLTVDRPLFIFVDAIDEMSTGDLEARRGANPLEFPSLRLLPEGVFVVCSVRQNPDVKHAFDKAMNLLPGGYKKIALDASEDMSAQIETCKRYVRRICDKNTYINPYHKEYPAGEQKSYNQNAFVDRISNLSEYNFMILRCVLNDRSYWEKGGDGLDVVGDLEEFYQNQFRRMTGGGISHWSELAVYCFSYKNTIYVRTFQQMLSSAQNSGIKEQQIDLLLDNWIDQGLVLKDNLTENPSIRVYHFTFREFLKYSLLDLTHNSVFRQVMGGLINGIQSKGARREIQDGGAEIYEEWLTLALRIAVARGQFGSLCTLLTDKAVWENAAICPGKIFQILTHIISISVTPEKQYAAEAMMKNVAKTISELCKIKRDDESIAKQFNILEIMHSARGTTNVHKKFVTIRIVDFLELYVE